MEFNMPKKERPIPKGFDDRDIESARAIYGELERKWSFIKAGMLSRFARDKLPLYVFFDDVTGILTEEKLDDYVKSAKRIIAKHNKNVELHPIKLSEHWERFTIKDAEYLDQIRYGVILGDAGFLEPIAELLAQGRIRPSMESINMFYAKAGMTLQNAQKHLLQAVVDLYWGVMDAAHALVMNDNHLPPAPAQMADVLDEVFVARGRMDKKHVLTVKKLYELYKQIEHRSITEYKGSDWDVLLKDAQAFIQETKKLIRQ